MSKSLLKPKIQQIIDFKGWSLRPLQNKAIECIINKTEDIIISAPTASGKTEAALFPTISETYPDIQTQLKILYISPLIALINDQYERLCKLNEGDSIKINITKWHSEVSYSKKTHFLKEKPFGILVITPESLESFLVNQRALRIFENIEYYIIDEFHDFLGEIRGDQLKSILNRIDEIALKKPRKILLSATLDGDKSCREWLHFSDTEYLTDQDTKQKPLRSVQYFEDENRNKYYKKLDEVTSKNKSLIFGNSKAKLELVCHEFKNHIKNHTDNKKLIEIHHGSLDKKIREKVETKLKEKNNISVFCTNTLELGIDINNTDQVSLLEPPFSVSSFVQRIGRSGRKKGARIKFNLFPTMIPPYTTAFSQLRTTLIRSLALIDLKQEGWIEPKEFQTYTYSIFVHQMLAILAQNSPSSIFINELYMHLKAFHKKVSTDDYKQILNYLIKQEYLSQNSEERISLGIKGINLTKTHDFYSVFSTEKEWDLFEADTKKHLGTVSRTQKIKENDILLFSGTTWKVLEIHQNFNKINLTPITDDRIKLPKFISGGGSIHRKVHEKMLSIYEGSNFYSFLNEEGNKALQNSRQEYQRLLQFNKTFIPMFMGSQVTELISFILHQERKKNYYIRPCYIGLYSLEIDRFDLSNLLKEKYCTRKSIESLVQKVQRERLQLEKYDYLLPDPILQKSYIDHQFSFNDYLDYLNTISFQKYSA